MHKRILLIGDTGEILDEGARVITNKFYEGLRKKYQVKLIDTKDLKRLKTYGEISKYKPDIIHYLPGPKLRSIMITWFLSKINKTKAFISTPNPTLNKIELFFGHFFQPDLLFCQSLRQEKIFNQFGFRTQFLPNGIDIEKFYPVNEDIKESLRKKYAIPTDKFVVLHIGHLSKMRNIETLAQLTNNKKIYTIVIGAASWFKPENSILSRLKNSGVDVRLDYFSNIHEIYQLADCYIFPGSDEITYENSFTKNRGSPAIEIPLTVLEAMSCNLKILTKKFGGLVDLFEQKEGFLYYSNDLDLLVELEKIINDMNVNTRNMILKYDWDKIIDRLSGFYEYG